jgi:hypothetical protein
MKNVFQHNYIFNRPLRWNTASVTTMQNMFLHAPAFNQPLDYEDGWDTARVTSMESMFYGARVFDKNLTWNTSSLTTMKNMFRGIHVSPAFNSILVFDTSKVEDMSGLFAESVFNRPLQPWNTAKVRSMSQMFYK